MDKSNGPKEKILIVDDEPIIQETLKAFLTDEKYTFHFAINGREAIQKAKTVLPDVILLDVMMPGMNGFEVCRRLKSETNTFHIPIILVTALDSPEDITRGLGAGADEFVAKPVDRRELKARVRSMLRIKHQYDDLENTVRQRDELTNLIVHDMRSPLNIITGHGDVLLKEGRLNENQKSHLKKIKDQSDRLNKFIDEMLMVSRMEQGKISLNPAVCHINQIVERVVSEHRVIAEARNITLNFVTDNDTPPLSLDEHLFSRVIDNLLSNALKFSPPDSEITVQISSQMKKGGKTTQFRIFDQGIGILDEFKNEIFNKYKIAELKEAGIHQVGLGLFFCRLVIEAHGGRIWVENNHPTGAVFCFELPVNPDQSA